MKSLQRLALAAVAVAVLSPVAMAGVLWDQTDVDAANPGFFNSESGAPPFGLTVYAVADVTVNGAWTIQSITQRYSAVDPNWGLGIFQGAINIFPKTGSLPTAGDDATAGVIVPMSATLDVDQFVVTASGLNINLAPGDYWIGITPDAPAGFFGPEIHLPCITTVGDPTSSFDIGGFPAPMWMHFVPGVDGNILIEGEMATVSVESKSWGAVKSLFQ